MHELIIKSQSSATHIISAYHLMRLSQSNTTKKPPIKIGQWVFSLDSEELGWKPLSAAVCASGMIALYPVRKIDLFLKDNAVMYSIRGVRMMKPKIHYLLIDGTGLTGLNWRNTVIDRK